MTTNGGRGPWRGAPARPARSAAEYRIAACLHADVSRYCYLIGDDVEMTVRTLNVYRALIGRLVAAHGGRVIDESGDSLLAEFPTTGAAVQSAIEIQRQLRARNAALPPHRRIELRMGIDRGEVLVDGGRIYGECVNVAARVQELAAPGGICVAGSAFDDIDRSLPLGVEYLGEREVKNIRRPLRVYQLDGMERTRERAADAEPRVLGVPPS